MLQTQFQTRIIIHRGSRPAGTTLLAETKRHTLRLHLFAVAAILEAAPSHIVLFLVKLCKPLAAVHAGAAVTGLSK